MKRVGYITRKPDSIPTGKGTPILSGILLGLLSALFWGTGDFLAKKAVDRIGPYATLFFMFATGSIFLGIGAFFFGSWVNGPSPALLLGTFLSSLFCVFGYYFLYYGFQVGSLSVVSTITSAGALVSVGLSIVLLKEWPTPLQFLAIGMVITGVILVSFRKEQGTEALKRSKGLVPAVLSAFFFGSYVVLVKMVSHETGPFLPVFLIRGIGVVLIGGILVRRKELSLPPRPIWKVLAAIGFLDAVAFISLIAGIQLALVSIVSPLSSLFTVVTVALARIFLKERLQYHQLAGFLFVTCGVILLSL